jgi:hypothetical protein
MMTTGRREGCKYSDPFSRGALIFMQQPSQAIASFHLQWSRADPTLNRQSTVRRPQTQAAVRPPAVVMIHEDS